MSSGSETLMTIPWGMRRASLSTWMKVMKPSRSKSSVLLSTTFTYDTRLSISRQDDLAFKADDGTVEDRLHEKHPVDIKTDDALRPGEACGSDKTGLYEPHRRLSRKQSSMVVEVVALHHMIDDMCFEFHESLLAVSVFRFTGKCWACGLLLLTPR